MGVALGTHACRTIPPVNVSALTPTITKRVADIDLRERAPIGRFPCNAECEAETKAQSPSLLVEAGFWIRTFEAGFVTHTQTPSGVALVGNSAEVTLAHAYLVRVDVMSQDRDPAPPLLPNAQLRAVYRWRLTPQGKAVDEALGCRTNPETHGCKVLHATGTSELSAVWRRETGWVAQPGRRGRSGGAGGFYWN